MMANPASIDYSKCYTVIYDKNGDGNNDPDEIVMMLPESILPGFAEMLGLSTPADYTIDEESKTITLTASGYQKGGTLISMLPDEEDD